MRRLHELPVQRLRLQLFCQLFQWVLRQLSEHLQLQLS